MSRARVVVLTTWVWLLAGTTSFAQVPEIIHVRQPVFRIPFKIEPGEQARLREVQLHLSEDQGQNWRFVASAGPEQRHFPFKAERDGLYIFMVRTKDENGRLYPASLDRTESGQWLRVMVDTQLPVATLRALPQRQDQLGIEWEARDDNLDLATLQLDYRVQGVSEWAPLAIEAQGVGQKYWTPLARGTLEVRLRVRDKADNQGTALLLLPSVGAASGSPEAVRPQHPPVESHVPRTASNQIQTPSSPNVKIVNTTEISLNYALEDVGPSGVSLVELWMTRDGRNWQRHGEDSDKTSPFLIKVNGEGAYGFALVVRSGVGIGDRPPQLGEPPQMWVEVDLSKPSVQVVSAEAGRGADAGNLSITWKATDKNLAPQPISLLYAEQLEGPWASVATGLDNTGRYVWPIAPGTPFRFYVRVEAVDRGGNIDQAETAKQVIVDLAQPKGRLLGVDVGSKAP